MSKRTLTVIEVILLVVLALMVGYLLRASNSSGQTAVLCEALLMKGECL